jgi:hypothetical protein
MSVLHPIDTKTMIMVAAGTYQRRATMTRAVSLVLMVVGLLVLALPATAALPSIEVAKPNVEDKYIIQLREDTPNVNAAIGDLAAKYEFEPFVVYGSALKGFAAALDEEQVAALKRDPSVAEIEPDQILAVADQTIPNGARRAG